VANKINLKRDSLSSNEICIDLNSVVAIPLLAGDSSKNKKADSSKNRLQFNKVPFAGRSSNEISKDLNLLSACL